METSTLTLCNLDPERVRLLLSDWHVEDSVFRILSEVDPTGAILAENPARVEAMCAALFSEAVRVEAMCAARSSAPQEL